MQKDKKTENRIQELIQKMTLEEKIHMIHGAGLFRTEGVPRLGIPPLKMSDGPMGVRHEFPDASWIPTGYSDDYVSYLPSNSALASAWNRELAEGAGEVLGEEARGRGKDVILGPGINIKRSPLCGRNFEYMSEDPYLTGELAVPFIQGIQKADVSACVKHFAMNNQETERMSVEVKARDRAVREIYFPAFRRAAREGNAYSFMGAYNQFRGEHCCESRFLLGDILREEWGYDGMIVSDWGGVHSTEKAAESPLDIEMSVEYNFDEYHMAEPLRKAVEDGKVSEALVDEKVKNILRLMFRLHMLGDVPRKKGAYNTPEHRQKILDIAREATVLLKNDNHCLPLETADTYTGMPEKILVIGDNAVRLHSNGGGSAEIKALYETSPLLGIKKILGGSAEIKYVPGYYADDLEGDGSEVSWQEDSLEGGYRSGKEENISAEIREKRRSLREEAVKLAAEYDKVILIGGQNHLQDLEGQDRPDMRLPYEQDQLIEGVLDVNPNTILVMVSGSPVEMPWIKKAHTLIWQWYAGMEGGTALAEVIFGLTEPSGRLPETFPVSHRDCSAHCVGEFPGNKTVDYKEDIFVGYRYYDTKEIPVLFPFGYGLSYTEFKMWDLKAKVQKDGSVHISLEVQNTGKRNGKEVVQIYVGRKNAPDRPKKELKEFRKISLSPGEKKTVDFTLTENAFQIYDEEKGEFTVISGAYMIYAGSSVNDIWDKTEVTL